MALYARELFFPTGAGAFRRPIVIPLVCAAMLLCGVGQGPAEASHTSAVTAVKGSAFGYFGRVGLFGGPKTTRPCSNPPTNTVGCGPAPAVTLPPGGSAAPLTAAAATGDARFGPATVFTSGPLTVSTQGTTGPGWSVTSSANVQTVNRSGQEVFTAQSVAGKCSASGAGTGGSTTITKGTLQTSEGTSAPGDETVVAIPTNPAPNTTYEGRLSVGDRFRYVFNEQIVNPDGSIIVNAAHQRLLGPSAVGELVIGQSVCGGGAAAGPALKPGKCANAKRGTNAKDRLVGTPAGDAIFGLRGNDLLSGLAGDDCLFGGPGADRLVGGPGNDRLVGGPGNDRLVGGPGRNRYSAGSGKDTVNARNRRRERVDCGPGRDKATIDRFDRVRRCERVRRR